MQPELGTNLSSATYMLHCLGSLNPSFISHCEDKNSVPQSCCKDKM